MGVLIYDGECGFCTNAAMWSRRRLPEPHGTAPSQQFDEAQLAEMGLTRADVARAAWWYQPGEPPVEGAECISRALCAMGGRPAVLGKVLWLPGVRVMSGILYRWVASHRALVGGWVSRLSGKARTAA